MPKKNNEIYEVNERDVLVKTVNAIKEKVVLSIPRKHGMLKLNSGGSGGAFMESAMPKAMATP